MDMIHLDCWDKKKVLQFVFLTIDAFEVERKVIVEFPVP